MKISNKIQKYLIIQFSKNKKCKFQRKIIKHKNLSLQNNLQNKLHCKFGEA